MGDAAAPLLVEIGGGVARLTLNRPAKRNALNRELVEALTHALARTASDPDCRVLLIRGAGRDFCAGADLAELSRARDAGAEEGLADASRLGELFRAMRRHPRPIVAAVHGRALAGGCGLATACDLVLADEGAELGFPEVHLGFVPAMVMTMLRRKVPEGRAFELVVHGARIPAIEAERIGLVNRVIPAGRFTEAVDLYVAELAERPAAAVELTKRLLYGLDGVPFEEGIARGAEVNALARLGDAFRAGVGAFLDGRGGDGGGGDTDASS